MKFRRRRDAETSRDRTGGAASVEVDEFTDGAIEVLATFLVGDPVDLPSDPAGAPIAGFVRLRLESPAVPRHVVDLDTPLRHRVGAVEVYQDPVWEAERILADEHDAVRLEGS